MSVKMRQLVEREIAQQVIKDLLAAGYSLGFEAVVAVRQFVLAGRVQPDHDVIPEARTQDAGCEFGKFLLVEWIAHQIPVRIAQDISKFYKH